MTFFITALLALLLGFIAYYFTRNLLALVVVASTVLWVGWLFEYLFEHILYFPIVPVMFSVSGVMLYFFGLRIIYGKPSDRS